MAALIEIFPKLSPEAQESILNGPGLFPPPGVTPNLIDPPNKNKNAYAFIAICLIITCTLVLLRAYSKIVIIGRVKIEDGLALLAVGGLFAFTWIFVEYAKTAGFYVHQYNVRFRDMQHAVELTIWFPMVYGAIMLLGKTAVMIEWTRLFVPSDNKTKFWWFCVAVIIANAILCIVCVTLEAVACIPLKAIWQPWIHAKCIDKKTLDLCTGYFNLLIDLFIVLLPQKVIWSLQMSLRNKIGVSIIFSLGILAVICAIGRTYYTHAVQYVGKDPGDTLYSLSPLYFWSYGECVCVIVAFCIPAIPKAVKENWTRSRAAVSVISKKARDTLHIDDLQRRHNSDNSHMMEIAKKYNSSSTDSQNSSTRDSGFVLAIMGPKVNTTKTNETTQSRRRSFFSHTFFNESPQQDSFGILQTTEVTIHSETASQVSIPRIYGQHPHNQPWIK